MSGKKGRRKRRLSPEAQALVERFKDMLPGQSFFVPGVKQADMVFLRRLFAREGLGYSIHEMSCDEIYQTSGVRVWREHGEYDEL